MVCGILARPDSGIFQLECSELTCHTSAADILISNGCEVVLLEGRDRIGGRVCVQK